VSCSRLACCPPRPAKQREPPGVETGRRESTPSRRALSHLAGLCPGAGTSPPSVRRRRRCLGWVRVGCAVPARSGGRGFRGGPAPNDAFDLCCVVRVRFRQVPDLRPAVGGPGRLLKGTGRARAPGPGSAGAPGRRESSCVRPFAPVCRQKVERVGRSGGGSQSAGPAFVMAAAPDSVRWLCWARAGAGRPESTGYVPAAYSGQKVERVASAPGSGVTHRPRPAAPARGRRPRRDRIHCCCSGPTSAQLGISARSSSSSAAAAERARRAG
jgi:hypothetical protein